jgi:hypothetical protein
MRGAVRSPGLLLCVVCACETPRRAWETAADGGTPDPSRPFLPRAELASAEPAGSSEAWRPPGGLWRSCYTGFRPTGEPKRDATRLALLCGPVTGMERVGERMEGSLPDPRARGRHSLRAVRGECYRLFAVGDLGIDDLDVTLRSSRESRVAGDDQISRSVVLDADRPVCTFADDTFTIEIGVARGAGAYALEAWRLPAR